MTSNFFFQDLAKEYMSGKMKEPWTDAKIYAPYSQTQGLLYENAEVYATKTLLKIVNLPCHYEERPNVEFMSKNGRIPILRLNNDNQIICGFNAVYELMVLRGLSLTDNLPDNQLADLEAYIAVVDETLRHVEMWMCWLEDSCYQKVTSTRYGSVYHWPLNIILPYLKRREIKNYMAKIGWGDKNVDDIVSIAENCFQTLSTKLGNNTYFFGNTSTHLDALVFGHIFCISTTLLDNNQLMNQLKKFKNLENFALAINENYCKVKIDFNSRF